ncbi:MAG: Fe-S-binding domain-containing protein [Bdellovibrionaceae bacterium]|nr:Fe-S-binding domain-containing protein [Pseudobdellovibrionaceae bacterium]|tara:strand:+ start:1063 stop:2574 length:1512 start_codon:yes stop_codon:yes gene_type:complete
MFLSILVFSPLVLALIVGLVPKSWIRPTALILSILHFGFSLLLFQHFDPATANLQLVEQSPWIPTLGIQYFLGVDGISFWLVILSTFLVPFTILASWTSITERIRFFHINLFFLSTAMLGTFLAMDAILFYVFFEASLIPMYFMIGIWGGARKLYATLKFFIYTMFGSLLMLLAIIGLIFMAQEQLGNLSASVLDFYKLSVPFVAGQFLSTQTLMFFAFCLAFAIKVPMFPVHTWLPDAHVEAPTPGSVILAAVMLKMGTYGFLRFVLPIFPEAAQYYAWLFLLLAVVGIVYGALVAMVQTDVKKLVAYSSVSHMGYVMLGLFAFNIYGTTGGLYQMLNHGISTGALFILVGMIYERTHSREIKSYGGLAKVAPWYTIAFLIVTFSSIAVPLTNGFIGEFLILLGGFQAHKILGGVAVLGVVLGAAYMLWMVKRVFFGTEGALVAKYKDQGLDINFREVVILVPFILLIFWMGLFPNHFLSYSKASLDHFVNNMSNYELKVGP